MENEIIDIVEIVPAPSIPSFSPNTYLAVGAVAGVAVGLAVVGVVKWRKRKAELAAETAEDQTAE